MTERLTPAEAYRRLQIELLEQGKYPQHGDAHYLFKKVSILDASGVRHPGTLRLEDYQSWSSVEYDHYRPVADQRAQERLLSAGRAILGLQFYRDDKAPADVSYSLCIPNTLSPDTAVGMLFYEVEGLPAFIGMPEDPSAPSIVRANTVRDASEELGSVTYSFVDQPYSDEQFMLAYEAVSLDRTL